MISLINLADEVQRFLLSRDWRFCIIGGLALQRWGEPRLTTDVDITLLTGFGNEQSFIDELVSEFEPRRDDAVEFALRNRVLLLQQNNIGIDISLGGLFFEESVIRRASYHSFTPKVELLTCSAEDLIVMKAFAGRSKDWGDLESVVIRQEELDWGYVYSELEPLAEAKYEPEIIDQLKLVQKKFYQK
jgi:hypothetical protein